MEKLKIYIFNAAEIIVIILLGLALKLKVEYIIGISLTFIISRTCFGTQLHFTTWYKCLIWSALILLSLFVILNVDLILSTLFAVFTALILSDKFKVKEMFLWTGKNSKYQALKDFIATSPNHPILLEHEEYWRKNYPIRYDIFIMYFRENKTYQEIAEIKDFMDNTITKRECATIYSILEQPLHLPPVSK